MNKLTSLMTLATVTAVAAAFAAGCSADPGATPADGGPVASLDADEPPAHSTTRRMTIDQLEGSVPVVSGNLQWRTAAKQGGGQINAYEPEQLGATLGRPDYIMVLDEPAEMNSLYVKFTDDMARYVCNEIVVRDAKTSDGEQRTMTRFIDNDETADGTQINENLRYLLLRFLGQYTTSDADSADLKAVFDGTVAAANEVPSGSTQALEGWRNVCIALYKSPAFHVY
jgi:hypothetical protein